jgi:hypothetical protein
MTTEDILTSIIQSLTTLEWKEPKDLLDKANEILYPLKESQEIVHYYFSAKEEQEEVILTIFVQKDEQSSTEAWELGIQKTHS